MISKIIAKSQLILFKFVVVQYYFGDLDPLL